MSSYVSILAQSPFGSRFANLAPADDILDLWWRDADRSIVKKMLEHLPTEVDHNQLVLVGLSNGARGAAVVARDPAFSE